MWRSRISFSRDSNAWSCCSASETSPSSASVMPRQADRTIAWRLAPPSSTMRATRRKQSASATLEPPNLCTIQELSVISPSHSDSSPLARTGDGTAGFAVEGARAAAARPVASAARRAAFGSLARLVDAQAPSAELLPVQRRDGAVGIGTVHFDEAEAARPAGLPVGHQLDRLDLAELTEQL